MSVQKGERRKMYDNIDYSVEVNSIKRLAPSASRYNFRSGGSRVNTAALRNVLTACRSGGALRQGSPQREKTY